MSHIILRGHWCDIIVLNVHTHTEDGSDGTDRFQKELEHVLDQLPKHHTKILLEDVNAKVWKGIFKPTTVNENLHEIRKVMGLV
jgi:hypothetical protein